MQLAKTIFLWADFFAIAIDIKTFSFAFLLLPKDFLTASRVIKFDIENIFEATFLETREKNSNESEKLWQRAWNKNVIDAIHLIHQISPKISWSPLSFFQSIKIHRMSKGFLWWKSCDISILARGEKITKSLWSLKSQLWVSLDPLKISLIFANLTWKRPRTEATAAAAQRWCWKMIFYVISSAKSFTLQKRY